MKIEQQARLRNPLIEMKCEDIFNLLFLISSDRTEDWTIGFAKLANALYLKDADQDGYLTGMSLIMIAYSS